MSVIIPNMKFIKDGDIEATNILINTLVVSSLLMVGFALFFTFFD